jgi:hypothetical protein
MRPLVFQFSVGGLYCFDSISHWTGFGITGQLTGLFSSTQVQGSIGTFLQISHRASFTVFRHRDSYGSRHPTGGSRPLESPLLTPGFSPLKILRVKSQHSLFWLAFRDLPRLSTCVSQRLVPIRDRYKTGLWLFLLQR